MHRFLLFISVFVSLFNAGCVNELYADEIRWTNSPQIAVDNAYGSGRMILISVHARSCQFCKKMEQVVWRDQDVEQIINRDFVPLKINEQEHSELIQKLEVTSYPTTFIFSTDRVLLARLDGFISSTDLKSIIERLKSKTDTALTRAID